LVGTKKPREEKWRKKNAKRLKNLIWNLGKKYGAGSSEVNMGA